MNASLEEIPLKTVDGAPSKLGAYAGKVRLVVNRVEVRADPAVRSARGALQEVPRARLRSARVPRERVRRSGAGQRSRDQGVLLDDVRRHVPALREDRREGGRPASALHRAHARASRSKQAAWQRLSREARRLWSRSRRSVGDPLELRKISRRSRRQGSGALRSGRPAGRGHRDRGDRARAGARALFNAERRA
ncbi:MAG: hypothetical protein QOI41_4378 [Myxococcales bacterium]|nr:hypothetical protein [Myxococcales bacterium]